MGNLKYLGTTFDNEKRKLWVKIRNDGDFTEARTKVEYYLEGGFQGSRQKDIKVANGQTVQGEFEYPPADVDTAKINIKDARTGKNIGTWSVKLKEAETKYTLSGYVKDKEGNPISYATVEAFGVETKTTAANGYYKFDFDQGYSGDVTAGKAGYKEQTKTITLTEGINSLNFELEEEIGEPEPKTHNRIYGTVKGPIGEAVQYANIIFGGKTAVTNSAGEYEIKDVWYSGEIICQASGYETASKIIEAPAEGDLEVNFSLAQKQEEAPPEVNISPLIPPLQGVDSKMNYLAMSTNIQGQQLDVMKTLGELDESLLAAALRQVGLDDWADKYNEVSEWLIENFGVEMPGPNGEKRKVVIITGGLTTGLKGLAGKLGLSTAKGALTKAGGAIAGAIGGLSASSIIKGITGAVGTVVFAEFICEEAVQTAGMGVYMASQTRDPEVVKQALENYKNILNATKQIHDTVKHIDPLGSTFEAFFLAAENNIANYENLISRLEEKKEKQMTKTDILRAYKEELIDEETAKSKLKALNYTDEDINVMLNLTAKEKLGKLKVTSKPTHAQIVINGQSTSLLTSESMELPPGSYAVTVYLNGYKMPAEKDITIEEGKTAEVHFDLERKKIGYLHIRSNPSQAAIEINDIDTRLLTPQKFELEEGKYKITLKYKGYKDKVVEQVEVKEGETTEKYLRLVRA